MTHIRYYSDVIMGAMASKITSLTIVYSTVYSGTDQSKHQSSASLAFVWGIHRGPVNSPHKWPVTRKMFPLDDVIMLFQTTSLHLNQCWLISNYIPKDTFQLIISNYQKYSFKKMHFKMSSAKWRPFCFSFHVSINQSRIYPSSYSTSSTLVRYPPDIHLYHPLKIRYIMMTSSNGNIFRVTGPLCGDFTGHRWFPLIKASEVELWCSFWSAREQTVE